MKKRGILECISVLYIFWLHASNVAMTWVLLKAKPSDFMRFNAVFLHVLKCEDEIEEWTYLNIKDIRGQFLELQ